MTSPLSEQDLYLFNEGTHFRLHEKLGAHAGTEDGKEGTWFAVWAPNAERVSVIGDWNLWDKRASLMTLRGASGVWEAFLPGTEPGTDHPPPPGADLLTNAGSQNLPSATTGTGGIY